MDLGLRDRMTSQGFPLLSHSIDALLWPSLRAEQVSAWHGHVSFAHWIVQSLAPSTIVELGTHNGVSFSAFCNAVKQCRLPTRCYAVDTWMGDAHAGNYDGTVFSNLEAFNREHFADFAEMLRCFFHEALPSFPDRSIDLLHIDGLHTLEAVTEDFTTWYPKLSDKAVVLFHDISVHERGFGVWQLWADLTKHYPHFSFNHSSGLGVLAVGSHAPELVRSLCALDALPGGDLIRGRFESASLVATNSGRWMNLQRQQALLRSLSFDGTNLALGCATFQSSTMPGESSPPGGAVNGVKNGHFGFHTVKESDPWWMVDLGSPRPINEVVIYNRLDEQCPERARNIIVTVSTDGEKWTELHRNGGKLFGGIDGNPLRITCHAGMMARFVRIRIDGIEFLHLDEVEVYG
jgi:hypothetical protein